MPMVAGQKPLVVGNRFRHEPDHPGFNLAARVPDDPDVAEAERLGPRSVPLLGPERQMIAGCGGY